MEEIKKSVTQIYEHARRELGISRDDYALCAYGLYRAGDPRSKRPGWCCDPKEDVAYFIGISRPGLYKMLDRMVAHGLIEVDAASGFFRATGHFIDTQEGKKAEAECKLSLQPSVNKVYSNRKQSLQPSVNKVTPQYRGIVRVKEDKEEREEERVTAPPLPPVGDSFAFGAEKEKAPPVPPPPPNSGPAPSPADYARPEPFSIDWFVDAVEAANHDKAADDAGLEYPWENEPTDYTTQPVTVTTFAPPEMVYETLPGGNTLRAEVHGPAERAVVKPKAPKPKLQPRAVEIPETHAAVAPELARLLCKKHYLQKSAERLAAEMVWLFSKPVAFALRHVQDSLSSPKGAWAALDFTGCEQTFARWQQDERLRAQAQQGPNAPVQPTGRQQFQQPQAQSPIFGERRLTA